LAWMATGQVKGLYRPGRNRKVSRVRATPG